MKKTTTKKYVRNTNWDSSDDAPALTKKFLKKAVKMPPITDSDWARKMDALCNGKKSKRKLEISIDSEVVDWFKGHSKNYQASVNHVLRHYILSHDLQ